MRRTIIPLLIIVIVTLAAPVTFSVTSVASSRQNLVVVSKYWRYEFDADSSYPHKIHAAAEIRNDSAGYVKNVAVRVTLRSLSGQELYHKTDVPLKEYLAPGESTFFRTTIYDDSAAITYDVDFLPFGDPSTPSEYPYIPDPTPTYIHSQISGGYITYFGEYVNNTQATWSSSCWLCNALNLVGVYYQNGQIVEWDSLGVAPDGHIPPGGRIAFRFSFERAPGASLKLFSRVEPLPPGEYATTWEVQNLQWHLGTNSWGAEAVTVTARILNTSNVAAKPDVQFVARDATGQWIGWTSCFIWEKIQPGAYKDCSDEILSINMHVGTPRDIRSIEVLVASDAVTNNPYPSPTPTITPIPTPTFTSTPIPTSIPTPTKTPTPILKSIYIPWMLGK